MPLLIVFPGLLALVMHARIEYPDMALPWVVKNLLPPGLSGLMFVALIAALQSTLDSSINSSALIITRDLRGVILGRSDPVRDLVVGRRLSLVILLAGMAFAPSIGDFGGIYVFIQTLLSLFQGPMLALLVLGALTRQATPRAGLVALVSGVPLAGLLLYLGLNMLHVAFLTFCYALVAIRLISRYTRRLPDEALEPLVYDFARRPALAASGAGGAPAKGPGSA